MDTITEDITVDPTTTGADPGTPLEVPTLDPPLLRRLAESDAAHDRDGTYVADNVDLLRAEGWLGMAVPTELGGAGAPIRVVADAQRTLARSAPSTALVTSMHQHVVLSTAFRWRRGATATEPMLRKVAAEAMFVASTGGNDFLEPSGEAREVDGGFLVSGRKRFVSGALSAGAINTWVVDAASGEGLAMGIPTSGDGVRVDETWDSLGMRGTGSHDIVLEDVFVPEGAVAVRRPLGVLHPSLQAIAAHAFPVIMAVYLGVAEGARDTVVAMLRDMPGVTRDTGRLRMIGEVDQHLATADRVLRCLIADLGDDVQPSEEQFVEVMLAKRAITQEARAAVDGLMDVVGGAAYSRRLPVERAWRDLRAAPFHPLTGEQTLHAAGALALDAPLF